MTIAHRTVKWHQAGPVGAVRSDQVAQRQAWQAVEPPAEAARLPGFAPDSVIHIDPAGGRGMGWHSQTEAAISEEGGDRYIPIPFDHVVPAGRST